MSISKKKTAKKTAAKKAPPKKAPPKKAPAKKKALPKKKPPTKKKAAKKAPAKKKAAPPFRRGEKKLHPRTHPHASQETIDEIVHRLERAIENPECELNFASPFELLTATILAAQSTDKTVNQVMPTLLARYPDSAALAQSEQGDVEALVLRTGFFRNKTKAIRGMAQHLVAEHGGEVPRTLEQMVELPGVARKTANVVLGTAYGIPSGFIVDTHVTRVSARLALSANDDPVRIEQDLCADFPKERWIDMSHRFILHGRYTCLAKRPLCEDCAINEQCPSRQAEPVDPWQSRAIRQNERTMNGLRASRGR